jgi:hypothetical protein
MRKFPPPIYHQKMANIKKLYIHLAFFYLFVSFLAFFAFLRLFSPQPANESNPKPKKQPKNRFSKRQKGLHFRQ